MVGILVCGPQVYAQEVATCVSNNSDTDGDGWGWENNASCRISAVTNQIAQTSNGLNCVDTDGDGWGWDGEQSCQITSTTTTDCIDTDNDGWGWNGVASCRVSMQTTTPVQTAAACVDLDGDGYGWDGTQTCIIDEPVTTVPLPAQESVIEPYLNRYETTTEIPWLGGDHDEITSGWIEGNPDAPLGYPVGYSSSVVLCEDPDVTVEDPSNPGFFFDAARGKTCSKTSTVAVPAPEPVEFTNVGAEVFYENGNQWSCFEETRPNMVSEFERNGRVGGITFEPSGIATIVIGNATYTDPWQINGHTFEHWEFRGTGSGFRTPVSYTDDGLFFYRSGLTRLQCQRIVDKNYPSSLYGEDKAEQYREMWDAFIGESTPTAKLVGTNSSSLPDTDFAMLSGDELVGRTLQCGEIYGHGTLGIRFSTVETVDTVTAVGVDEYDFSGTTFVRTEISNGVFRERTGSGGSDSVYYRYTDNLILRYKHSSGAIGSSSGFAVTMAACTSS